MFGRPRSIIAIATSIAVIGAGAASVVGQVRQRRRPRAHYDTTQPTTTSEISWEKLGLKKAYFRAPKRS